MAVFKFLTASSAAVLCSIVIPGCLKQQSGEKSQRREEQSLVKCCETSTMSTYVDDLRRA